ncbi:uncharacterized protein TM35_000011550 [Trypanosoma theileri]|uniref:Uncharacterized protein n=1 Tax=Trypanosoma theileri TaxID=67003 RepID=A0A1X0P8T6_9TRYP|nr:uncharacterized protein TM35_000011550 [Trypanosoma theileri]ORC93278.1 hypothetical protein TM35_000011550 [Trypanosoma theileri]
MEEVRPNENLSKPDASQGEGYQHNAVNGSNDISRNDTEIILPQSSSSSSACTSFFQRSLFPQVRDGVHSPFSSKSFHLPHWWDIGDSRFLKVKKDGVTYAVLVGKTLDDVPYCFRVRRDEKAKKAFFTPMALLSSSSAVEMISPDCDIKAAELETLPDIVQYEKGKFRAALQQILDESGESYTPEWLEDLVKNHTEEGSEFLVAFRALHPSLHSPQVKDDEIPSSLGAVVVVEHNADDDDDDKEKEKEKKAEEVAEYSMEEHTSEKSVNSNENSSNEGEQSIRGKMSPKEVEVEEKEEEEEYPLHQEDEEEKEEEEEVNRNGYGYVNIPETSEMMTLEENNFQEHLHTLREENERIKNKNKRLYEETKTLKTERNEYLLCIENLRKELMELTHRMNFIEKRYKDEMNSLHDEIHAVSTKQAEVKSTTLAAVEERVDVVCEVYGEKITQFQQQQETLQNEVHQITNTLRVSQEQSEKLLSILELREKQLETALEELRRKDSPFCNNCQEKLRNSKESGDLNTQSLLKTVTADEKDNKNDNSDNDNDNDDGEPRTRISTRNHHHHHHHHHHHNNKKSLVDGSMQKDNEMKGMEEENKTSPLLRMGHSTKNKKYHHNYLEQQHLLSYRHSCGDTFQYSPWRRAPYAAVGYTNETLYHQHTPDRGVGITTLPPKSWCKSKREQFKNKSPKTPLTARRSQHQSTTLQQE